MAQPAAPSDTGEEEEDTRGPEPGREMGPWTMGIDAPACAALWGLASLPSSVWKQQQIARGAGKHPRVGRERRGCHILFPSPLSLPWESVWIMHRAKPPVGRVWAPAVPPGEGSPVVTASWGGTGLPLYPRPYPTARWQVGNCPTSPGTAQQPLHPPPPPYLKAGSEMLSQPLKCPQCFSPWFSHQQKVFLLLPRAVFPPGRV